MIANKQTLLQIFGSIMKRPSLLFQTETYNLTLEDFNNSFEKYIFGAIYNIAQNKAESISVVDVDNYLSRNPTFYGVFEKNKGVEFLQDAEDISNVENFHYYYTGLKKSNALRDLRALGINTDSIYPSDTLILEDNTKQIEAYEKMTVQDIFQKVKASIAGAESRYGCSDMEVEKANANLKELLEDLNLGASVGKSLQGKIYNTVTRGATKGKCYLLSAGSGVGKALPNTTIIPTLNGMKTVGEVKVGDKLFDRHGRPTTVLGVYPQLNKKQKYKVTFKSGRIAECCDEHLWSYYNSNSRDKNKLNTNTLKEIIKNDDLQNKKGAYKYLVPIAKPAQWETKTYGINPYVLGLLLGDGSFRYNSINKSISFSSQDEELVAAIASTMGYSYSKNSEYNYSWTFHHNKTTSTHKNVWVEEILKDYPNLWNVKSEDKFIPQEFLFGDIQQRIDLLNGLLDTDGSVDNKGRISFFTISNKLKNDVIFLCESLGMTVSTIEDIRDKYSNGVCYKLNIKCTKDLKEQLFKLKRKKTIIENYISNGKRFETKDRDAIISIEPLMEYVDMTCFEVDNAEHLFLMNNFIVTHNTRTMVGHCCSLAYPVRYNPFLRQWEHNGFSEKVLYVATEQKPFEIKRMILAYLSGINQDKINYGQCNEEENEILQQCIQVMDAFEDNFIIARLPEPNIGQVKSLVRDYALNHQVEYVFYDYIFTTPSLLGEFRDLGIRNDQVLRMLSTELKDLAAELQIFVMSATQITGDIKEVKGIRNELCLRDSKSIPDKADVASINARVTQEELNLLSAFCEKSGVFPTQVCDIYKNRDGRYTECRIWSRVDLGTLRREDLFITDAYLNPIDDFSIVDFVFDEEFGKYDNIISMLNINEIKEKPVKENYDNCKNNNEAIIITEKETIKEEPQENNKIDWDDLL